MIMMNVQVRDVPMRLSVDKINVTQKMRILAHSPRDLILIATAGLDSKPEVSQLPLPRMRQTTSK
jgi:hypothetical protein